MPDRLISRYIVERRRSEPLVNYVYDLISRVRSDFLGVQLPNCFTYGSLSLMPSPDRTGRFRPGEATRKSLIKLFLRSGLKVLGYFHRYILAFFDSSPKRFNEASISFVAAGLRGRSGCVRQCWRRCKPKANEKRNGLVGDFDVVFEPFELAGVAVEPAADGGFHSLG